MLTGLAEVGWVTGTMYEPLPRPFSMEARL